MTVSSSDTVVTATDTPIVLGVDGGGTKTLARVAQLAGDGHLKLLGEGTAGSSNQVALGVDAAFDNLRQSIDQACSNAGVLRESIAASVVALAGSGTESAQRKILGFAAKQLKLAHTRVAHDGEAALAAGTPAGWGVALIVGTGAVAFGMNQSGSTAIVGGWGYWFGDEGSAYWIGLTALRAVAQADDGRACETKLTPAILQDLEVESARELLNALRKRGDVRLGIANLAPLVCDQAESGDEVAVSLLDTAAQHWARHVGCVAQQLDMALQVPLAIAGGVLCGSEYARAKLAQRLASTELAVESLELVQAPVDGCLKLAARGLVNF
ncbi:MAG: BadF/BadG/BcrA/BcrD ATPase family protein [Planctomycetota bacterium]